MYTYVYISIKEPLFAQKRCRTLTSARMALACPAYAAKRIADRAHPCRVRWAVRMLGLGFGFYLGFRVWVLEIGLRLKG